MITANMFERLSEWFSNLSLLFIGIGVLPYIMKQNSIVTPVDAMIAAVSATMSLWLSLHLARISERRK